MPHLAHPHHPFSGKSGLQPEEGIAKDFFGIIRRPAVYEFTKSNLSQHTREETTKWDAPDMGQDESKCPILVAEC
jgi:hypothetical protein